MIYSDCSVGSLILRNVRPCIFLRVGSQDNWPLEIDIEIYLTCLTVGIYFLFMIEIVILSIYQL